VPAADSWSGSTALAAGPGGAHILVDADAWLTRAREAKQAGGRLLAIWAGPGAGHRAAALVRAALQRDGRLLVMTLPLGDVGLPYPGLHEIFPAAARMQRAAFDVSGIRSDGPDQRAWLRHAAWPAAWHPLRSEGTCALVADPIDDYPFVRVEGDGVHEVPVGPVHAGIIEPGHFRFSIVGEKVLRLEERLGYTHKGIERRFTQFRLADGHRLAARISGDSCVAYSWAWCQAVEGLLELVVPARALYLRALALEIERMQNHLGDLGALGNDGGFAFGLAQFSRLKEQLMRAVAAGLGQRYLFDLIVPGGTARDIDAQRATELDGAVGAIAAEARALREIYEEHSGLRDRFVGAGRVSPELAQRLGLTGLAGRASGQAFDLRVDGPWAPYDALAVTRCGRTEGDVAARVAVRFDELQVSAQLIARILSCLEPGPTRSAAMPNCRAGFAVGLIEGWRGPVFIGLEVAADGAIVRCHPHDPSWQNWPVLEHAVLDNILPDFPLINKSFNLSYSGHDL